MGVNRSGFPKAMDKFYDECDRYAKGDGPAATQAAGTLTFAGQPSDGDAVTIDGVTYTYKTAITAANHILIGASAAASRDNLVAAINGAAGAGTTYGAGTPTHTAVTAVAVSTDKLTVTAVKYGSVGNAIVTTETGSNTSWGFATLVGGSSVKVADTGHGKVRSLKLTLDQVHVTMVDEAGVIAYGSKKLWDFAQGHLVLLSALANLTVTKLSTGTNIIAAFNGDFSLGSVAASNNASLSSTEADMIPSTATPAASAGVTTAKGRNTGVALFDGTATAVDAYLNFLIDDTDQNIGTGPAYLIVSGTIELVYVEGGDY